MKPAIILYDITDNVAFTALNRPEAANGLSLQREKKLMHPAILCDEDRVTVYSCRQMEGRIRNPETARTAGCVRAPFNREDSGTYDGFADDLFVAHTGR